MKRFTKLSFISLFFLVFQFALTVGFVILATPTLLLAQTNQVSISELKIIKEDDSLVMNTPIHFNLPTAVEEALRKGVAIYFVAHVDVSKERWYWTDKEVLSVNRYYKLVYQPLTRRWRLNISSVKTNFNEPGISLPQWFDQLEDALAAINRAGHWKLMNVSDLESGQHYKITFSFGLDTASLPKPLQIGLIGQSDWALQLEKSAKFTPESLR
jgi:hypothetical protein